ncbi:hypothetical protein B0H14DRAFT_2561333 [Mycena olivaceomarginata]|nr:hypothetical protein B0H14DRAFT_2561333 [Mycena olivaceomarginata]
MSGIVHTPQRFKNWTQNGALFCLLFVIRTFLARCAKDLRFSSSAHPAAAICCPANFQPMANGSEENLSGHPHSGGSGCMIVTFCQFRPPGQTHDERNFIRTSSLTSPFNVACLSGDSAVPFYLSNRSHHLASMQRRHDIDFNISHPTIIKLPVLLGFG